MFLHHRRTFYFLGGALGIKFLAHLGQTIRPGILAQLNLTFDLSLLKITQCIFLRHRLAE